LTNPNPEYNAWYIKTGPNCSLRRARGGQLNQNPLIKFENSTHY
jgi:hypothetical protein